MIILWTAGNLSHRKKYITDPLTIAASLQLELFIVKTANLTLRVSFVRRPI